MNKLTMSVLETIGNYLYRNQMNVVQFQKIVRKAVKDLFYQKYIILQITCVSL